MCELSNLSNGFIFVAVVTGTATFFLTICSLTAVADQDDHAKPLVVFTTIISIIFILTGFLGVATK